MSSIVLTTAEMLLAGNVGLMRRVTALKRNTAPKYGAPPKLNAFENDVVSSMAECAAAKYFNLHWHPAVGETHRVDVGGLIEVRAIRDMDHRLVMHNADDDNVPFVLVYADPPLFDMRGWLLGCEGKQEKFWEVPQSGRAAYFIKQAELHRIEALRVDINVECSGFTPSTIRSAQT